MDHEWTPPEWMYRERKPPNDGAYLENLTRCIFQAGLSWRTVDSKWPNFRKAFDGFDVSKVADYGPDDVKRLLADEAIIRNRQKILVTIHNATEFKRIASEHRSFRGWLDAQDKSDNYAGVVKNLIRRFKHVGESTARIFLYSVGEDIKFPEMAHEH